MHNYEVIERNGSRLGWIRLMHRDGPPLLLAVIYHWPSYYVIVDDHIEDWQSTEEAAFGVAGGRVAGELLGGAWIDGYELPEGWHLGMKLFLRPSKRTRLKAPETVAPGPTPVAAWLMRRGWSVYEAALRTGFSQTSLRRWRDGYKAQAPAYAERMIEMVDALVAAGVEVERKKPHQLSAIEFTQWIDRQRYSRRRAAEVLGVSKSQVSAWANNRARVPSYATRLIELSELQRALEGSSRQAGTC